MLFSRRLIEKLFFSIFFFILFANLCFSFTTEDIYKNMKDSLSKLYPKEYRAEIIGDIVSKQIATIPQTKITKTKDDVKLIFHLKHGEKPALTLENVDSFYRNMFGIFEPALETTGFYAVLGGRKTYDAFSKAYKIISVSNNGAKIEAVAEAKGEDKDYTVRYTINSETYVVEKAVYYFKKTVRYNIDITYRNEGKYTVVDTIRFVGDGGKVSSYISFINYKF